MFRWDDRLGRYRGSDGKIVAESRIRLAVDAIADAASDRMADLSERLRAGDISLADWQREMMRTIKTAHVASGVAAQGGRAQMDQAAYGYLGRAIRDQYAYLRNMADGIASGTVPLDGRLIARAGMYGQHARVVYENVRARDARARGYSQERNVLHAQESCSQCVGLARIGWVEIGTLPPIGSRRCLARCRCTIARRRSMTAVEAA